MLRSVLSCLPCIRARLTIAGFALLACFLVAAGVASAQQRKPLATDYEERYDDPPALPGLTGLSPRAVIVLGDFTSYQVNVNASGQNITGDAANEPSIAVDPTGHNRIAIGWRQFNSVSSNFRQGGYGYTTDGGTTWTFPGVLENNVFRSDPVLFAQDDGKMFYNSLLETFFDTIWRSLNGGMTWTNLQPTGNATGGDKQWHLIDNNPASTGYHFQYQAWSTAGNNWGGRQFSRSIDGGSTWMNPIFIPLHHFGERWMLTLTAIYLSAALQARLNRLSAFARQMLRTGASHQRLIRPL